jgi:hypothetical protein
MIVGTELPGNHGIVLPQAAGQVKKSVGLGFNIFIVSAMIIVRTNDNDEEK